MTDPFDEFPQTLDLLAAVVPSQTEYVTKQGRRLFVTVVEYWNTRTTIRFAMPVNDIEPQGVGSVIDDDGVDYGVSGGGGGSAGAVAAWDGHISTEQPVPQTVNRLHISSGTGQDFTVEI